MPAWERRRILVWGKTRPDLSKKYREIVCTGGVFASTRTLVRLYPVPLRYMNDETLFAKYNWVEADVYRNEDDNRPESYKIRYDGIRVVGNIKTRRGGDWSERTQWILTPDNIFKSVEELRVFQEQDNTSLGIVKPANVTKVEAIIVGASEKASFMKDYDDALKQMDLPIDTETGREIKPLTPPDYRFQYSFTCRDSRCKGHTMTVLDWEIDALYFGLKKKYKDESKAARMVVDTLRQRATAEFDLRFFLGNIHNYPKNFTIVGLWYPKKSKQLKLYGDEDQDEERD